MSLQALVWAIDQQEIAPIPKLTLIGLANYAGVDNTCWPSATTLARVASCSERAARAAIAELKLGGWIAIESRPPKSSLYTLRLNRVPSDDKRPKRDNPANGAGCERRKSPIDWGSEVECVAGKVQQVPIREVVACAAALSTEQTATPDPANCAGLPEPLPCTSCMVTVNIVQGDHEHCAGNPSIEPSKESKVSTLLRNGGAPTSPTVTPRSIADELWTEGRKVIRDLTGSSQKASAGQIGELRAHAKGNCAVVLEAIRAAKSESIPGAGVMGFCIQGIRARLTPPPDVPIFRQPGNQIAERRGLNDKPQYGLHGLTRDTSAFTRDGGQHAA